jgi:integral membrane sensor domain MASE1
VLIQLVVFRTFTVDLTLETKRDWTIFLLFGVVINNIVGATWGALMLNYGNVIKTDEVAGFFSAWLIGNIFVIILIVPLACQYLTPKIPKSKLFIKYYWEFFFSRQNSFFDILRDSGTEMIDEIPGERNHQVYQQRDGRIEK